MDIPVRVKWDPKGANQVEGFFERLAKSGIAAKLTITALSAAVAKFAKDSAAAAMADQKLVEQLNRQLITTGWASYTDAITKFLDKAERVNGVIKPLEPEFLKLFNATDNVAAAQELLNIAFDVAAGTGSDLQTVIGALSAAYTGNRKGLTSLNTGIDKTTLTTAKLETVIKQLANRFKGDAAASSGTYQASIDRLQVSFQKAQETIGYGMMDAFELLNQSGTNAFDSLGRQMDTFARKTADMTVGVASIFSTFREQGKALPGVLNNIWAGISNLPFVRFLNVFAKYLELRGQLAQMATAAQQAETDRENRRATSQTATNFDVVNALEAARKADALKAAQEKKSAKEKAARDRATAAAEARRRAEAAADKAKQAALDELSMKFDIERINIVAAAQKTKDAEAQERLRALLILNTASYNAELVSIEEVMAALGKLGQYKQQQWMEEQRIIAENRRLQQQALAEHAQAIRDLTQEYIRMGNAAAAAASRGDLMKVAQQQATTAQAAYNQNNELFAGIEARFPGILQPGYTYGGTQAAPVNVQVQIGNQTIKDVVVSTVNEAARDGWKFLDGEWYR